MLVTQGKLVTLTDVKDLSRSTSHKTGTWNATCMQRHWPAFFHLHSDTTTTTTSWNRLEMKPKIHKGHGSGTLIASLQALQSKANSLEISQSLRSLLTDSSQVSLGLSLPFFILSTRFSTTHRRLRRPPLDISKLSQPMLGKYLLNWCHPYLFSNSFVPDSIPL